MTTYGGAGGSLDSVVDALVQITKPTALGKRYGPEWWLLKVVNGVGTAGSKTIDADTFYRQTIGVQTPLPQKFTVDCFIYCETGKAYRSIDLDDDAQLNAFYRDGTLVPTPDLSDAVVVPADGWVHMSMQRTLSSAGYDNRLFQFYGLSSGATFYIALPRIFPGHVFLGGDGVDVVPNDIIYT